MGLDLCPPILLPLPVTHESDLPFQGNVAKYEGALYKIDEAFGSIASYKQEIDALNPQLRQAQETIRALVLEVEERKKQYIAALERCKEQEDKIIEIQGPLDSLRRSSNTMLDQVR